MRVITEPKVTVVGHTTFLPHPDYGIPEDGTDAERLGAFSGKSCYDSFGVAGRPNIENQRQVIAQQHGSVLEHSTISVFVEGFSRGCSLEFNRHRVGLAISQRSTRYTKEEDAAIVLDPYYASLYAEYGPDDIPSDGNQLDRNCLIASHIEAAQKALFQYRMEVGQLMLLNPLGLDGFALRKWARGKARNILPHALETRATYTGNWRMWRHFLGLRSAAGAESEIRRLAVAIYRAIQPYAPTYFEDVIEIDGPEGIPVLQFAAGKV